jgi:hypothetical protein
MNRMNQSAFIHPTQSSPATSGPLYGLFAVSASKSRVRKGPETDASFRVAVFDTAGWDSMIKARFEKLAAQWREETLNISSDSEIILNDAYQQIIGMGPQAIPEILCALRESLDFWFPALRAIIGADPVDPSQAGNREAMRRAWLDWGSQHGYC